MRFYSRITRKPNTVVIQVKNGNRIVSQNRIATFKDGVCDTDDPKVIEKLQEHPDKFRTDKPWPKPVDWKDTAEGKALIEEGKKLGLDISLGNLFKNIRKEYLEKLIKKEGGKVKAKLSNYRDIVAKAKEMGIDTHKRKKEDILADIEKGCDVNV